MNALARLLILTLLSALICAAACTKAVTAVKVAKSLPKGALKVEAKIAAGRLAGRRSAELASQISARHGDKALQRIRDAAKATGVSEDKALRFAIQHRSVLANHQFSAEALGFGLKHGGSGVFFLRHPVLFKSLRESLGKTGELAKVDHKAIVQAWRWADDKAIGGSLARLRDALTKAGMNGGAERDFCEELFRIRAQRGKVSGYEKGTELLSGHWNGRKGIDLLGARHGRICAIEFGTGRKPGRDEMSWGRIRTNLADFLEHQDTNSKINLRGKGFPPELVNNPSRLRTMSDEELSKYVQREVYAAEIDKTELAKLGGNVIARQLN